jgi:hypothetical protein
MEISPRGSTNDQRSYISTKGYIKAQRLNHCPWAVSVTIDEESSPTKSGKFRLKATNNGRL